MRALLVLALLAAPAGCFERGLDGCDTVDGQGNWVAVRAVWNGTNAPIAGACVRAVGEGVALSGRTDELGIAILHLSDGTWTLSATVPKEDDHLCAYQGTRTLDVGGSADVVVRVERDVLVCA